MNKPLKIGFGPVSCSHQTRFFKNPSDILSFNFLSLQLTNSHD